MATKKAPKVSAPASAPAAPAPAVKRKRIRPGTSALTAKPRPRSDYKPDARVKGYRKDGTMVKGFVTKVTHTKTGPFIHVNVATKSYPVILQFRPVHVRGY